MLLVGSHALKYWIPSSLNRIPMDFDFICTYEDFEEWKKYKKFSYLMPHNQGKKMVAKNESGIYEFELAWPGSTAESLLRLTKDLEKKTLFVNNAEVVSNITIAPLDLLYTIKMSHRYLKNNPHFLKTMNDIHVLRDKGFSTIPDKWKDWYKQREKETYNYSHPNLKQNKMGFFNPYEGVDYRFNHDSIHQQVARLEKPAYTYYQKDGEEVMCDKNKFFSVDEKIRLYGVVEEATVLALERSQIPFKGKVSPKKSFDMALEKVCTSITSGYFREFAWENYNKVQSLYDPEYVNKFWKAVEEGKIEKFTNI